MATTSIKGLGVSAGAVYGPAAIVSQEITVDPNEAPSTQPALDMERVRAAMNAVAADLSGQATNSSGTLAEILDAQANLATDQALANSISRKLEAGTGATHAVAEAVAEYAAQLRALGGYMAERAGDLRDIGERIVANLRGLPAPGVPTLTEPSVLIARDLSPAQTASLDPELVLAVVTSEGGATSHTAILTAQLGIVGVVGAAGAMGVAPGMIVGVDGSTGEVLVEPSDSEISSLADKARLRAKILASASGPGQTKDGVPIKLLANIASVSDAEFAAPLSEGSGLFRSEVVFLSAPESPSVEEQTEIYSQVLRAYGDRRVVMRTLDSGADKPLAIAGESQEENPALGLRGIRFSELRTDILDTQLQALANAQEATEGDLWVMAPMVANAQEAKWFADRARSFGITQVGIMIEVPAAAIRARQLLEHVDFASIGTNDLTQYVMAADRVNPYMSKLNSYWEGGVLDAIAFAVEGATDNDKPIGVCGESGGDPLMALVLVGLGVNSLSMATSRIAAVRFALSKHTLAECQAMAAAARESDSAIEAREAVMKLVHPDILSII